MIDRGIHVGLSDSAYHAREKGVVSKSALDRFARSPAHYIAWLTEEARDTPAQMLGRAFHCAVLEPEKYARHYAAQPDFGDMRTKVAKAARDEWMAENAGRTPLDVDDAETIERMRSAVMLHPVASRLLVGGDREVVLSWEDVLTGLPCKARTDAWRQDVATIVDLKSTDDASPAGFARSVERYRYDVQDALYRLGMRACGCEVRHFVLVAVEKEPPHAVGCYQLDERAIAAGGNAAREEMVRFARCKSEDRWPAYSDRLETLSLPRWSQRAA